MGDLSARLSRLGGRRVLLFLGGVYVATAVAYPFLTLGDDVPLEIDLILALIVGVPGLVVLLVGYRLPRTDVRPEFYPTVTGWCFGAIAVILLVLGLIEAAGGLRSPVENFLILTALASVAGLVAGRHEARAKSRARDLELRNRELRRTKDALEETVDRLQTSNERLEQFTYAASHDLQEPLRMVSSYLQLLERRYGDELDDDAEEFIGFAVGGADRMRTMVQSLLEYSRVSTDGDPLEPTDAGSVLDDVLADLAGRIEATDATVTADDLPTVTADPDQLALLFENLVSNALDHGADESPQVHVGAERTEDAWRFAVTDEGVGIDPEFHDRIFTVFERLRADEEDEAPAGGIGLALCERIVERHGGDIWVDSAAGEGATFYFTVPTSADQRPEGPVEAPSVGG